MNWNTLAGNAVAGAVTRVGTVRDTTDRCRAFVDIEGAARTVWSRQPRSTVSGRNSYLGKRGVRGVGVGGNANA